LLLYVVRDRGGWGEEEGPLGRGRMHTHMCMHMCTEGGH
jgi:hypothetical protein